jgi:hypothetical protein
MNARASHLVGPLLRYAHKREYVLQLSRYASTRLPRACSLSQLQGHCVIPLWPTRDESPIADEALGRLFDDSRLR